ncbi:ATP-binding protein [Undibacterium arcticum]|uniref:ATP-binding protein n=1 Tax=Undibacterium arcticum TaxID=1762892 RepID=A0ABV7EVU1_9BURK
MLVMWAAHTFADQLAPAQRNALPLERRLHQQRIRALQKQLTNVRLLNVDELGYVPFTAVGAELLFEVFSRRYEQGTTLVTSKLAV